MPDRDGQQIGVVTKALVNSVPWSITNDLSFFMGVNPPSAWSWSSVRRNIFDFGKEENV